MAKHPERFVQTVYHFGSLLGYRAVRTLPYTVKYGPLRWWENPDARRLAEADLSDL